VKIYQADDGRRDFFSIYSVITKSSRMHDTTEDMCIEINSSYANASEIEATNILAEC
jgi:hypothetical protein